MTSNCKYPILKIKMFERGIKKSKVCEALQIAPRTFDYKMNLKTNSDFSWGQTKTIQEVFFPDIPKEELFATENVNRL